MASKTLLRTGASFLNRLSNSFLNQSPRSNHQIVSRGLEITPKLFPSISKLPSSLQLQQNDAEPMKKLTYEGFLFPFGFPSMRFFLPDGNDDEPMLLFPKRTFQPSLIRRKRNHGFFARQPGVAEESLLEELLKVDQGLQRSIYDVLAQVNGGADDSLEKINALRKTSQNRMQDEL